MKKIILLIIVLILAGGSSFYLFNKNNVDVEEQFEFTTITQGDLENLVSCTGTLEAMGAVEVGTELSGTVSKVYADYNDNVTKNQILAILDTTQLAINLRSSKADLIRAEVQYNLSQTQFQNDSELYEKEYISELDFETSKTSMQTNYANLLSAQANLEKSELNINKYSVIRSPINGKVIDRSIEEGQTVAASLSSPTLFYIAKDLAEMEIHAYVDESDIGSIAEGMIAVFTVESYPDETFQGVVKQIRLQPETISNVVNYTVIVETTNESGLLLPGMTATIDFILEQKENVLLVKNAALRFTPDQTMIMEMMQKRRAEMQEKRASEGTATDKKRPEGRTENTSSGDRQKMMEKMQNAPKLWYLDENGDLQMSMVETGSTAGSKTEIVSGRNIEEGTQIITKQTIKSKSSSKSSSSSKNMGQMRPF